MNEGDDIRTIKAIGAFPIGCTGTIETIINDSLIYAHLTKNDEGDDIDFHAPALDFNEYYELI